MKFALVAALSASVAHGAYLQSPDFYSAKFDAWQSEHGVEIAKQEYDQRLAIFSSTDDEIELHNAKNLTWTKGHNIYSHLSWEEFRDLKNLGRPMPPKPHLLGLARDNANKHTEKGAPAYADNWWCLFDWLPGCGDDAGDNDDIARITDWVEKGGVTPTKDQGQCGSCWSFSTTGAIEGAYFIKTGELVSFSEQQLVDCDIDGQDAGCNGGLMDNAFAWIKQNGGLCKEDDYPYKAVQNSCESCTPVEGSAVTSWVDVDHSDAAMMSALDQQTVSIAIQADQKDFQQYSGGVLTATCGSQLDHGVLAVGYGTMKYSDHDDIDYYRVKNSWGDSWGTDGGYIYLERGNHGSDGQCGMLMAASYPVL